MTAGADEPLLLSGSGARCPPPLRAAHGGFLPGTVNASGERRTGPSSMHPRAWLPHFPRTEGGGLLQLRSISFGIRSLGIIVSVRIRGTAPPPRMNASSARLSWKRPGGSRRAVSGEPGGGARVEYAPGDRRVDAARVAVFAPYAIGIYRGNGFMGAQQDWKNAVRAAVDWEYE